MKTLTKRRARRFQLKILDYGNSYYIERVARLEAVLLKEPRLLEIEMIGAGEVPADMVLIIRSVLTGRSSRTRIVTHARSSLRGASVLLWLLGDFRTLREDAQFFFRRATLADDAEVKPNEVWKDEEPNIWHCGNEIDPEEGDYVRVLELINEFLPVKELAGHLFGLPVLKQFGLIENEKVDHFLATAFGAPQPRSGPSNGGRPEEQPVVIPKLRQVKKGRK